MPPAQGRSSASPEPQRTLPLLTFRFLSVPSVSSRGLGKGWAAETQLVSDLPSYPEGRRGSKVTLGAPSGWPHPRSYLRTRPVPEMPLGKLVSSQTRLSAPLPRRSSGGKAGTQPVVQQMVPATRPPRVRPCANCSNQGSEWRWGHLAGIPAVH